MRRCSFLDVIRRDILRVRDTPNNSSRQLINTKPNAHEFGEKEMREWWKEKDFLGVEGEQVILPEQTEDEIVARIVSDCAELRL